MNRQGQVNTFQYFAIIYGTLMANGVLSLPRLVSDDAGRAGWVSILAAGSIALVIALSADLLASFFPDRDAASWPNALLGPVLGTGWKLLYLVRSLVFAVLTSRLYAGMLNARVLVHTPTGFLALLVTLLAVVIAMGHMRGMARYAELAFYSSLPIIFVTMLPIGQGNLFNLRPILSDTSASDFLKSMLPAAYSFAGLDILWFAYPYLKNKTKSMLGVSSAILTVTLGYAAITMTALMVFGIERVCVINFPTAALAALTEILFLERLDSIGFFVWLSTVALTAAAQVYISARLVEEFVPKATFNRCTAFLGGLLLVASLGEYPVRYALLASDLVGTFDLLFIGGSALIFPLIAYLRARRKHHARA